MKKLLLIVLALFAFALSYGQEKIIGGNNTTIEQHPWQVSIRSANGNHFCGGSILARDWILTASHCVIGLRAADLRIAAGITMRTDNGTGQYRQVAQIIMHPNFNAQTLENDVALIRLTAPLNFNNRVGAIQLANNAALANVGITGTVSGWGWTTGGTTSNLSNQLQELQMPIISNLQANNINTGNNNVTANMIAMYQPGTGVSRGDSGGPLTVVSNGTRFLIGCSSWGEFDKDQKPTIYTRLYNYRAWIMARVPLATIAGPSCACYSPNSTVTVSDTNGAAITWNKSSNLVRVSSNNNQYVFKAVSGTRGPGFITATFNGVTLRHDLWVGQPNPPSRLSGPSVVLTGALVKYNSTSAPGATSYEWRLPYPFNTVSQFDYFGVRWQMRRTTGRYLTAFTGYGKISGLVQVWGKNKCGNGGARIMRVSHGSNGGGGIPIRTDPVEEVLNPEGKIAYPNPVDKKLYLHIPDRNTAPRVEASLMSLDGLVMFSSTNRNLKSIDVSALLEGQYILIIDTGTEKKTINIIVKH